MPRLLTFFLILTLCVTPGLVAKDVWTGVDRIVAIGDVHGDYDQFFTLLSEAGLVNKKGRWTGGKTHLVQTGDIPDRGPDTRKIIDLLMKLEKQAKRAGGYVHCLIGNHDAMNVYGDLRYVTPEEFDAFADGNSERIRATFYEDDVKAIEQQAEAVGEEPEIDDAFKADWYDKHPLGFFEQRFAYGPKGVYGKWIRSHNTIIRIDETLFVHAGVSPALAATEIGDTNETIRRELEDRSLLQGGLAIASDGPLWYRGLAQGNEEQLAASVDAALDNYGVRRIVIGHTPTAGTVMPRFGGKVLMIDVGLAEHYGGRRACLIVENGEPYTLHRGTRVELPEDTPGDFLRYLKETAALDPAPSPLLSLIERLEASPSASE